MKNKGFLLGFLPFLLISCTNSDKTIKSKFFGFDTYVETTLFEGENGNVEGIEKILSDYDALTDNYKERTVQNIYTINHTNEPVQVDPKLYDLLKKAFYYKDIVAFFNPLCGSLAKKWKKALEDKTVLSEEVINEEVAKISSSYVEFLDDNKVQRFGDAELDLGAIAKGYTLDMVDEYLRGSLISKYFLNGGSSSLLFGKKNTRDGLFTVGLRDVPNAYIEINDCFVSTSAVSEQSAIIDGVTYSHIVNPVTGSSVCKHDAVIVISDNGAIGDVLSTAMMMNTVEEIQEIELRFNVMAIVIDNSKITYTNNMIGVQYH